MRNAPRTLKGYHSKPRRVSCSRMYWFEDARNQNPVFRDQKMFPEVRNRPLLLMFFFPAIQPVEIPFSSWSYGAAGVSLAP